MEGIWNFSSLTPLERPRELGDKEYLTAEEAEEFARRALERNDTDRRGTSTEDDLAGAYNHFWYDRGTKLIGTQRTSLIVDPEDGRIPPLTPEGQKRATARSEARRRPPEGPEDLSLPERCLLFNAGPPMLPGPYNNNFQIIQTSENVVIYNEMIHDVRVIPLDGRPHLPQNVRLWLGDSRGRWQGSTLVVETTNFSSRTAFRGSDQNLRLTEHFTRIDPDTLEYQFTIDNPTAFTKPWSAQLHMTKTNDRIYEYACHEGNYAMIGILKGARTQETAARASDR
jgi:hypothetical protein